MWNERTVAVTTTESRWVNSHSPSALGSFRQHGRPVPITGTSGAEASCASAFGASSSDNSLLTVHSPGPRR